MNQQPHQVTHATRVTVPRPSPQSNPPPPSVTGPDHDPPLKDVLVELWQHTETLVRQELALASAELDQKAQKLKTELMASALGAGLIAAGALALVATVILLLALVMPAWLAALLTAAAMLLVGFVLLKTQRPQVADVKPERSLHSLEKDVRTFRETAK